MSDKALRASATSRFLHLKILPGRAELGVLDDSLDEFRVVFLLQVHGRGKLSIGASYFQGSAVEELCHDVYWLCRGRVILSFSLEVDA